MKALQSIWGLALLAVLLSTGCMGFILWQFSVKVAKFQKEMTLMRKHKTDEIYWSFHTGELENLAASLKSQQTNLKAQKAQLLDIEERVLNEIQELQRLQGDIKKAQDNFSQQIVEIEQNEVKNLRTLATAYTNISPEAAVTILREMDDNKVTKILALMKPEAVGAIFEEMATLDNKGLPRDAGLAKRAAGLSDRLRLQHPAPVNKTLPPHPPQSS